MKKRPPTEATVLRDINVTYRLHTAELPGSPDIVVRKYRKAIFVHGCFWHQHEGCTLAKRAPGPAPGHIEGTGASHCHNLISLLFYLTLYKSLAGRVQL